MIPSRHASLLLFVHQSAYYELLKYITGYFVGILFIFVVFFSKKRPILSFEINYLLIQLKQIGNIKVVLLRQFICSRYYLLIQGFHAYAVEIFERIFHCLIVVDFDELAEIVHGAVEVFPGGDGHEVRRGSA